MRVYILREDLSKWRDFTLCTTFYLLFLHAVFMLFFTSTETPSKWAQASCKIKRKKSYSFVFYTFFSTNIVRQHYLRVFLFFTFCACKHIYIYAMHLYETMGVAKKSFQRSFERILLSFALNLTLFVAFIRLTLTLLNINFLLHAFVL